MPQKIELTIPQLCHKDWNEMTPNDQGRFCSSCKKNVIDFSAMSDRQLAAYFKQPVGSICGRFEKDQLNRQIDVPKRRLPWIKYFFGLAIPAFLLSLKSNGQQGPKGRVKVTTVEKPVKGDTAITIKEEWNEIKGTVSDEKDQGIPFASVFVKGTTIGTVADVQGNFVLTHRFTKPFTLLVSGIGYESSELLIKDSVPVKCSMKLTQVYLGGAVVITTAKRKPIPLIKRLLSDTSSKHFNIYPNPVKAGSTIAIENRSMPEGEYAVHISNTSGQQVISQKWVIEGTRLLLQISVPTNTAGTHVIALHHLSTGKIFTGKIIIRK